MKRAAPPSGLQFRLELGGSSATVTEVGGGLRSYTVDGRELLDGYGVDEMCSDARGQTFIPWPNRIADGSYPWNDGVQQLPLSEPTSRSRGLRVETRVTNTGSVPCPYATGAHPYLTLGTEFVDDLTVELPAGAYYPTDERGIPLDRSSVGRTAFELCRPVRLDDRVIDCETRACRPAA